MEKKEKKQETKEVVDFLCTNRRCSYYKGGCTQTDKRFCERGKARKPKFDIEAYWPGVDYEDF